MILAWKILIALQLWVVITEIVSKDGVIIKMTSSLEICEMANCICFQFISSEKLRTGKQKSTGVATMENIIFIINFHVYASLQTHYSWIKREVKSRRTYNYIKHMCSKYYFELSPNIPGSIHQAKSILGKGGTSGFLCLLHMVSDTKCRLPKMPSED